MDSKASEGATLELKLKIATFVGTRKGMTVVDAGCGQGGFTATMAHARIT